MIERIAEVIRKYQALIDVESNLTIKQRMIIALDGIKREYNLIQQNKEEVPAQMIEELNIYLSFIEEVYNKKVSN